MSQKDKRERMLRKNETEVNQFRSSLISKGMIYNIVTCMGVRVTK
jgi:hypothetical protein